LTVEMLLGVVDLDESWRLETLLGYTGYVADRILDTAAITAEAPVDDRDEPAHQGADGERHQRQARVEPQQKSDREGDRERRRENRHYGVGGGLPYLLSVVGQPREQRTGGVAIEVADRK